MDDPDSSPATLVGEVLSDRYRISGLLGSGGMGSVYLATDEQLSGRRVAIKVPHDEFLLVPGFRQRFGQEIGQLIDLEHPHIVTILDSGEFDGRPFAVLQYLGGGSLSDRVEESDGTITVAEVLDWLPTVAESLDFIHRKGFLHRDIKPGNIFFDDEGHAFVADFGIATALGGEGFTRVTQAGTVLGSPAYMAPEYGAGEADSSYDQYALGVVVYRCLSGEFPHAPQPTPIAYLAKKMVDSPRPLGPLAPGASSTVVNAVMRALSMRPEERFATCSAFAAAVGGGAAVASGEEPVQPRAEEEQLDAATTYRLAAEPGPLAETVLVEEEGPPAVASAAAPGQRQPTVQRQPTPPAQATPPGQPTFQGQPILRRQPAKRRPSAVEGPAVPDDTALALTRHMLQWMLAFATGFLILSDGSYVLFDLANPLASIDAYGGLAALKEQAVFLVAITAAANLLLSLVAGYTVGVISDRHWSSSCVALAAVAVALTSWETGFLAPLVNSWFLALVSSDGAWVSMVPVPFGLLAGGYARSQQGRGRGLGAVCAALAVAIAFIARLSLTSAP